MIGILCALDKELEMMIEQLEEAEKKKVCGYDFNVGKLRGKRVVLCKCGVGKVNAAMCTQSMIR